MGHGDHWEAVEKDKDVFIDTMVPLVCQEGGLVGENSFCHTLAEVEIKEGIVFGLHYPVADSPVSFLALIVKQVQEGNQLWTAYPVCAEGPCTRLVVDEIKPWPNGIEGAVEAYMPEGESVCFFDPFFFLNKEKYREWAEIDVALSALAYVLGKFEPEVAEPSEEPLPESAPEQTDESSPASDAATAPPEDEYLLADYVPCDGVADSGKIQFVVEEAVPVACVGRLFWRLTGVIMRADDDQEMRIHVYASEQVLKGYLPQPGDEVWAVAWMQGRLLHVVQPVEAAGAEK